MDLPFNHIASVTITFSPAAPAIPPKKIGHEIK